MAPFKPNSSLPGSFDYVKLLCTLALIAASSYGLTQEPTAGTESQDPDVTQDAQETVTLSPDSEARTDPVTSALTAETFEAEELDAAVLAAGEAAMELVARLEARLYLGDLVAEDRLAEAVPFAERIVELTEEELGISVELGVALSNLGMLQRRIELYDVSEQNFLRAD